MATTLDEIAAHLTSQDVKFRRNDRQIGIVFRTERYKDPEGDNTILLVVELDEEGRYFAIFCPAAFKLSGRHVDAFLRACAMVQWETKLVQFEYDSASGAVRPVIEFPLEDAPLTVAQLQRCIHGLVQLVDEYYPTLERALRDGIVVLPERAGAAAAPPPSVAAVRKALLEALEQLARDPSPEAKAKADQIRAILESMGDPEKQ
jgi:hypothetical protein